MTLDLDRAQRDANKLHASAKSGTLKLDGVVYTLMFDHHAGVYSVTEPGGSEIVRFNTRKVAESPRYHGPTFTVDAKTLTEWVPDTYRITGHYGSEGQHPATLAGVPGGKLYMVERAS